MHRSTHLPSPISYGAIGATQAADLMSYPPEGFRPVEYRTRIGHGDARFRTACEQALSWQIQRRSGIEVRDIEAPPVDPTAYAPVHFDEQGAPIAAAAAGGEEQRFTADGEPMLTPGTTATLVIRILGVPFRAPVRVVYVIDEPTRKGFAYGTTHGHPEKGEESWVIEQTEDGSVWMTIRAFSRPARWYWWLVYPALRLAQEAYTRRYLRALIGTGD